MLARILPFALFMGCIGLEEGLRFLAGKGVLALPPLFSLYIYPLRAIAALAAIIAFRRHYDELRLSDLRNIPNLCLSLGAGIIVFILWINMDWSWATVGTPTGFDPGQISDPALRMPIVAIRLFSASIIVPVMEELFWRSFLTRYVVNPDFEKVAIGAFTPLSFAITSILFGIEHNFVAAGIMAGVAYNLLLLRTRSVMHCILSHAVTNFALGIYVLLTGAWRFW